MNRYRFSGLGTDTGVFALVLGARVQPHAQNFLFSENPGKIT